MPNPAARTPLEEQLRLLIQKDVIQRAGESVRIIGKADGRETAWLLDFRAVLLTPAFLDLAAEVFWEKFQDQYPFQVGGLETGAIALVAALVMKSFARGTPVNGFYIRKSRKHYGLQKTIEGRITDDPIILVDDLIHSGASFIKQIEILKHEGKRVSSVFAFVRYRAEAYNFGDGISLTTLYTLGDIGLTNYWQRPPLPDHTAFSARWTVRTGKPNYFYRVPKSAPAIDATNVYFGSDDGVMRALDQETGEEKWHFKIFGRGAEGKTIFSSPALHNGLVYFGAYDGNFYALDAGTGKKKWIYMDADWIGSSPCVAPDVGLVYVGLEYGLWRKRGGIVALDALTGKKKWEYIDMPSLTHGSPAYSGKYNAVAIGSNNGVLYLFRASDGEMIGQFQTQGDIKYSPTFDEERGLIIFGSFDGNIYILNALDGTLVLAYQTGAGIYAQPLVWNGRVYVSSLDKSVYCIDLDSLALAWTFQATGRLFASPAICSGMLYVGSTDGRLYEIDPATGRHTAYFQTAERITNKIAYNANTKYFFLLTYANELYCLERKTTPTV